MLRSHCLTAVVPSIMSECKCCRKDKSHVIQGTILKANEPVVLLQVELKTHPKLNYLDGEVTWCVSISIKNILSKSVE